MSKKEAGAPPSYQGPPPAYSQQPPPPQGYYPTNPAYQPPQNQPVVIAGGYDSGARFDGIAQPNIPPPPPGCAPNAAQMASMQGQNVVMTQQKAGFWEGGSGGGYTMF